MAYNPNQQNPAFNPNQQNPAFNPNQQNPAFNPNQQNLAFNPNQHHQNPAFNANQQNPAFNPNQHQQNSAFNPNQQNPAPNPNSALMQVAVPSPQASFSGVNLPPPKPFLQASLITGGIHLKWNMNLLNHHAPIASHRIFYCTQSEVSNQVHCLWKILGDVPALPLPMTCTLTHFVNNERYHFIICAVDVHGRLGLASDTVSLLYQHAEIA